MGGRGPSCQSPPPSHAACHRSRSRAGHGTTQTTVRQVDQALLSELSVSLELSSLLEMEDRESELLVPCNGENQTHQLNEMDCLWGTALLPYLGPQQESRFGRGARDHGLHSTGNGTGSKVPATVSTTAVRAAAVAAVAAETHFTVTISLKKAKCDIQL